MNIIKTIVKLSEKKFSKKLSSKIMGWFTTVFFVLILHDSQLILSKTFLWMIQTKMKLFFLKTSPDRLNLEMVFDVIDQPTSQSVVCSVFCHYPWKFCNKNTRCERVVLVDAPDYTVESLFWFQLHVISCWSSSRRSLQVLPVVGKPCNIYRLQGNPIIIMGFPCIL